MKSVGNFLEEGEIFVLPDGKILAHNITPEIAAVLSELNPTNELMKQRAIQSRPLKMNETAKGN